jgi:hypothetical protein
MIVLPMATAHTASEMLSMLSERMANPDDIDTIASMTHTRSIQPLHPELSSAYICQIPVQTPMMQQTAFRSMFTSHALWRSSHVNPTHFQQTHSTIFDHERTVVPGDS